MIIAIALDPMGEENEFETLKTHFTDLLRDGGVKDKLLFKSIFPNGLCAENFQIAIIDYGGLTFGVSGLQMDYSRTVVKAIEEKPNCLFVLWTALTTGMIESDLGIWGEELEQKENVIIDDGAIDRRKGIEQEIVSWVLRG